MGIISLQQRRPGAAKCRRPRQFLVMAISANCGSMIRRRVKLARWIDMVDRLYMMAFKPADFLTAPPSRLPHAYAYPAGTRIARAKGRPIADCRLRRRKGFTGSDLKVSICIRLYTFTPRNTGPPPERSGVWRRWPATMHHGGQNVYSANFDRLRAKAGFRLSSRRSSLAWLNACSTSRERLCLMAVVFDQPPHGPHVKTAIRMARRHPWPRQITGHRSRAFCAASSISALPVSIRQQGQGPLGLSRRVPESLRGRLQRPSDFSRTGQARRVAA